MKKSRSAALAAAAFALCTLVSGLAHGQQEPSGNLSTPQAFVQYGTKPNLAWNITYPEIIKDLVTIKPPGTITPKTKVKMEVRVIGASVKVVWKNSWGAITRWEWAPTEAQMSVNKGAYSRIFYNTQANVQPNMVVKTLTCDVGQDINFGGRYNLDGWSYLYTSTNSSQNVVALINGDIPPTTTPLYQQPTIEDFIKPYLDGSGRISIGSKDVIYLMELTHTDKRDGGFDLQDLALLVTFTSVTQ